jgi:hypothetical protein
LHDWAKLEPEEVDWAEAIGLPVNREVRRFSLPCPKLIDRKCSIFESRPSVCPGYRCQLLRDCDAGQIDLPYALDLVAQARKLFRAASVALTAGTVSEARERARNVAVAELLSLDGSVRDAALRERLRVVALEVFLDHHFRRPEEGMAYKAMEGSGEMNVEKTGESHGQA